MADISAKQVKELRDKTGAGMADCKKALIENDGDMEKAIDFLRKKGAASAAKRSDRSTNEGIVVIKTNNDSKQAIMLEVTCETDFVARNEEFVQFAENLGDTYLNNSINNLDELKSVTNGNGIKVEDSFNEILAKFSERIEIGRLNKVNSDGYVSGYIHGGAKLGVLVSFSKHLSDAGKISTAKDIAMQVAAMNPMFVDKDSVTQEVLDKEKEIYTQQAVEEGKPEHIAEKVALGRIQKFYKEQCLVEQIFVKDSSKTVKEVLKEIDGDIKIESFLRFSIGA